jgi:hypothetical protein
MRKRSATAPAPHGPAGELGCPDGEPRRGSSRAFAHSAFSRLRRFGGSLSALGRRWAHTRCTASASCVVRRGAAVLLVPLAGGFAVLGRPLPAPPEPPGLAAFGFAEGAAGWACAFRADFAPAGRPPAPVGGALVLGDGLAAELVPAAT